MSPHNPDLCHSSQHQLKLPKERIQSKEEEYKNKKKMRKKKEKNKTK
jgi:hypothetical protein